MPARGIPYSQHGRSGLVVIEKVDTRGKTGSMVVSKTGAAGIGEAGTRFADKGPLVGRTRVRAAKARLALILAAAAFVLVGVGRARGAVRDVHALRDPTNRILSNRARMPTSFTRRRGLLRSWRQTEL